MRATAGLSFTLIALAALAFSCSSMPTIEPAPPVVQPAPAAVAHLAIHVFQLVQPPATPEDDWDYHHTPGYTADLRHAFQMQLQLAGFTVVLERSTPADLVATIQSDMPYEQPGVATLVLTRNGEIVDRFSVPVQLAGKPPRTVHLASTAAVHLVEAMSRSANVTIVANEVAAHRPPLPQRTALTVAGGACPPSQEQLPPEPEQPLLECIVERAVHCQPGSPVLSAWQPAPFAGCPREIPTLVSDVLRQPARFSPRETQARRLAGACAATPESGDCCYVQFSAHVCR